jgi:hypothetical protein
VSQVKFKAEGRLFANPGAPPYPKQVEVVAGWDRPLGHYYLTIFDLSPDAEEETLWSTLAKMPGGGCSSVTPLFGELYMLGIEAGLPKQVCYAVHVRTKAAFLGIDVPEGFWERVEMREGNVVTTHVDGEWRRKEF